MSATTMTQVGDPRRWKALAVLGAIQFMLILDVTVVNVALPRIHHDLHFSASGLAWIVDGYTLTAGGFLLLGGRLADLVGRRRLFLIGVGLFAIASATCGAAQDPGMLVASRFAQGCGEALASPAAIGLVAVLFPSPAERVKALGLFGGLAGLGGTTGTMISGLLTNYASWRWIFFINVPVGVFAIIAVPLLVKESRMDRTGVPQPDFVGAITGTGGLLAIVDGLINASRHAWGDWQVLLPLLGGVALLALMVLIESRSESPLIPIEFFKSRTRVVTNFVTLFFSSSFFTYFFLLTLFEQQILGYSPIKSGISYLPFGFGIGAGIGIGTALMPKVGVKPLLTMGYFGCAVGLFLTSTIGVGVGYASHILPGMVVLAIFSGISFPAIQNAALHEVTGQDSSLASGVQQAMQQIGGAIGLAVLATLALRHAGHLIASGTNPALATVTGYKLSFHVGVVLLLVGGVLVLALLEQVTPTPHQPGVEVDEPTAAVTG